MWLRKANKSEKSFRLALFNDETGKRWWAASEEAKPTPLTTEGLSAFFRHEVPATPLIINVTSPALVPYALVRDDGRWRNLIRTDIDTALDELVALAEQEGFVYWIADDQLLNAEKGTRINAVIENLQQVISNALAQSGREAHAIEIDTPPRALIRSFSPSLPTALFLVDESTLFACVVDKDLNVVVEYSDRALPEISQNTWIQTVIHEIDESLTQKTIAQTFGFEVTNRIVATLDDHIFSAMEQAKGDDPDLLILPPTSTIERILSGLISDEKPSSPNLQRDVIALRHFAARSKEEAARAAKTFRRKKQLAELIWPAAAALTLAISFAADALLAHWRAKQELDGTQASHDAVIAAVEQMRQLNARANARTRAVEETANIVAQRQYCAQAIAAVYDRLRLAPNVAISKWSLDQNGQIELQGITQDQNALPLLVAGFENDNFSTPLLQVKRNGNYIEWSISTAFRHQK